MLTAIIKPRIEEIFDLVKVRLSHFNLNSNPSQKLILCGGGANLNNIRQLASTYFNTNVRIGQPIGMIGLPEILQNPTFSCLAGLLIKSLEKDSITVQRKINSGLLNYFGKIGDWFDQNL